MQNLASPELSCLMAQKASAVLRVKQVKILRLYIEDEMHEMGDSEG